MVVYVVSWTYDIALRKSFILVGDFSPTFVNLTVNQNVKALSTVISWYPTTSVNNKQQGTI